MASLAGFQYTPENVQRLEKVIWNLFSNGINLLASSPGLIAEYPATLKQPPKIGGYVDSEPLRIGVSVYALFDTVENNKCVFCWCKILNRMQQLCSIEATCFHWIQEIL